MPRRVRLACLALGIILGLAFGEAQAGFVANVNVLVTKQSGGQYLYAYTLTNAPTSTTTVGEFDLSLTSIAFNGTNTPSGAPITSINMQTGFANLYTLGDPSISFQSTDASTDVLPGTTASFSFLSTYAPVLEAYQLSTFDGTSGPVTGFVLAPATVPEPSSLALLALGGLGLVVVKARGKLRKPKGTI